MSILEKSLCPSTELRSGQRFGETVCGYLCTRLVEQGDRLGLDVFRYKVVANGEVLGSLRAEFAFEGHGDRALVVLENRGRPVRWEAELRE